MSTRIWLACFFTTVLTLGSWSCNDTGAAVAAINQPASLTGQLPGNPLQWKVITSLTDNRASTMSTLYGNDFAVRFARSGGRDYPPGSVLSLVTWTEQDDDRWFGARIPGQVKSVEFVTVSAGPNNQSSYSYEKYEGLPLTRASAADGRTPPVRAAYLLSLRASVMP
jgi:hypothetical protein